MSVCVGFGRVVSGGVEVVEDEENEVGRVECEGWISGGVLEGVRVEDKVSPFLVCGCSSLWLCCSIWVGVVDCVIVVSSSVTLRKAVLRYWLSSSSSLMACCGSLISSLCRCSRECSSPAGCCCSDAEHTEFSL